MTGSHSYNLKSLLKLTIHLVIFTVLTIATQTGGLIYLLSLILSKIYHLRKTWSMGLFFGLYLSASLVFIPLISPLFGRTPLPLTGTLRPLNYLTCLLNRHYVKAPLKQQLVEIANKMETRFEGTKTNYLDANFPFFDGFPLIPHLSHHDGKNLDLAFYYKEQSKPSDSAPSFIGYGICEGPRTGEPNYPAICKKKGYWQYNFLSTFIPQGKKAKFELDVPRTRELIRLLAEHKITSKIFIEPHLKQRWGLDKYEIIRFHGCRAVRHDDHIHTQIR